MACCRVRMPVVNKATGPAKASVLSNRGLHKALREVGVGVVTTDVGDRRVVEALRRERLLLGGEQSGHIVFGAEHDYIGDGMYTALRVLRIMVASGQPLSAPARARALKTRCGALGARDSCI